MRKLIQVFLGLCAFALTGAAPVALMVRLASDCGAAYSATAGSHASMASAPGSFDSASRGR